MARGFHCHANVTVGANGAALWVLTQALALQFVLKATPPPHPWGEGGTLKKLSAWKVIEVSELVHFRGEGLEKEAQTGKFQREEEKGAFFDLTLLLFNDLIFSRVEAFHQEFHFVKFESPMKQI